MLLADLGHMSLADHLLTCLALAFYALFVLAAITFAGFTVWRVFQSFAGGR
jgi:hypothetical protein